MKKWVFIMFLLVLCVFPISGNVSASETEAKENYDELIDSGIMDEGITYENWLEADSFPEPTKEVQRTLLKASSYTMQSGDIFVTNATSLGGMTGHAAIATSSNWVLDIPAVGKTTRQSTFATWKSFYKSGTVWVYRVDSKYRDIAIKAASWADRNYYSTTGSSKQNIFPRYGFLSGPVQFTTNPTYCSKIPYQAYWNGSGNVAFMKVRAPGFVVTPYGLVDSFSNSYKPKLVAKF